MQWMQLFIYVNNNDIYTLAYLESCCYFCYYCWRRTPSRALFNFLKVSIGVAIRYYKVNFLVDFLINFQRDSPSERCGDQGVVIVSLWLKNWWQFIYIRQTIITNFIKGTIYLLIISREKKINKSLGTSKGRMIRNVGNYFLNILILI